MSRIKTLPRLIDMLVEATVSGDAELASEIRETLDWRLDHLYWTTPREVQSVAGLVPGWCSDDIPHPRLAA
jgi:hypothetical protein